MTGDVSDLIRALLQLAEDLPEPRRQEAQATQEDPHQEEQRSQKPERSEAGKPPYEAAEAARKSWYLGIDVGTTGMSAVLLHRPSGQLYPIYWIEEPLQFRPEDETEDTDRRFRLPIAISSESDWLIQNFKPYFNLGIPHYSAQTEQWQPVVQWSDQQQVPLSWFQQALQSILATLKQPISTEAGSLSSGALGLSDTAFQLALKQLSAVIIGYPSNWSDTYSFNLREAVLNIGLVKQPAQIYFIEDAIATLLSVLRNPEQTQAADQGGVQYPSSSASAAAVAASHAPILHNADWQGNTLVLSAGASVTDLLLVNLPTSLPDLTYLDFHLRSLPFAGNSLDQDTIAQLLYPLLQAPRPGRTNSAERVDLQLEAASLENLGLDQLTLPTPGEPDLPHRYRLQQRLQSTRSGQVLLEAARCLKIAFQQQSRFTLRLGDRQWTILRQDMGSKVLLPYVQRLNRELNMLLKQTRTPVTSVNQVICTGGTASIGAIARWLRQKLPNATIIQDTYARSATVQDNCISSCSRVAYGLAVLPLHAHVLDTTRHQYNDYFLLRALLHAFPEQPVSANEMMQRLQHQRINTEACRSHILALLEGHLPPGLVPSAQDALLYAPPSIDNPAVRAVQAAPLFHKQNELYHPNLDQRNQLQHYLDTILANTQQTLRFPLSLESLLLDTPSAQ